MNERRDYATNHAYGDRCHLHLPHAPEPLFQHVSTTFPLGWTAVFGDNGIGESTLMSIVRGELCPDSGP